ncbi:serine beta-lactamase-like protein LACTB, mitochondrial [Denticeps clupeoides]|uniref:Beta-lactamase-related domain-containing protein n=1 Tax=Denticeps clupeoides TaxID=299321 RepID=A0AAY4CQM3_9TELE|nr:serine beta-lactamase-like protein LACTB, mitochondrial [Denticeps clupeoides]
MSRYFLPGRGVLFARKGPFSLPAGRRKLRGGRAPRGLWLLGLGAGVAAAAALGFSHRRNAEDAHNFAGAVDSSRDLVRRIKDEVGAPGMVAAVSVDGAEVWCEGFGYADLENRVPCGPETVMRIASVSKSLTVAAAAGLWQEGKLDMDAPVQKYVPEFPEKQFGGENVTITPRMILSHLSGIRHYEKDVKKVRQKREAKLLKPPEKKRESSSSDDSKEEPKLDGDDNKTKEAKQSKKKKEFEHEEYYLKSHYESVIESLDLFKDDLLVYKPGTTFLYSTHAFTLLSAVIERAAGESFLEHMAKMFREVGMLNTVPEENEPIIYRRARFYHFNKKGRIQNCPYVDNSYKWAGGGFLSTAGDLLRFGNAVLYSYQMSDVKDTTGLLPGILKPETAQAMWTPVDKTEASWDKDGSYGQGWLVVEKQQKYGECRRRRHYVSHTGGAVGASSVLLVLPSERTELGGDVRTAAPPQGVVVTIITNMQSVGLNTTALKIAHEFDKARSE